MSTYADGPPAVTDQSVADPAGRRRAVLMVPALLATLLLAAYALLLVVPSLLGYERYVLVGGSMEPTLHRGSLVFDRVTPVDDLAVGDVITYLPPGQTRPVSHRIVTATRDDRGRRVFTTRGDANEVADPAQFTLDEPAQARVVFSVRYAGYPLWLLGSRTSRMVLIGLPALAIAFSTGRRLWRQAGELVTAEATARGESAESAAAAPSEDDESALVSS